MKHRGKKFLSILLVLVMLVGMIQLPVNAATTPAQVSASTAAERVETLRNFVKNNSYGYKYFTVTGSSCGKRVSDHGCTNCRTTNLLNAGWIKNCLGILAGSDAQLPSPRWASPSEAAQYGKEGTYGFPVDSCLAFASIGHWFIYAQKNTDNVNGKHIFSVDIRNSKAQENIKNNARPGDMIVMRSTKTDTSDEHAAIYVGCSNSGITILECNYGASYNCNMQERTVSYSDSYRYWEFSRATNASSDVAVTSVTLNNTDFSLSVDSSVTATATVLPSNATNKKVSWASSNTSVATVSSTGVITAVNAGKATITVTTADGGYTDSVTVTVVPNTYSVTYDANGGSWSGESVVTVDKGIDHVLLDAAPERDGYVFKGWKASAIDVDGEWSTEQPTNGDYEIGYKYYTYGYEYDSDYTYAYGPNKNNVYSDSLGTYSAAKLRYFWLIESENKGTSFYPYKTGSTYSKFKVPYLSESGVSGTATIWNTVFYFESMMYRQTSINDLILQPGDAYTYHQDITLTAIWEEEEIVRDERITGIELLQLPNKLTYKEGYYVELNGAVLRLYFADGAQEDIALNRPFSYIYNKGFYYSQHLQDIFVVSLNEDRFDQPGEYSVAVQAFGYSSSFSITVMERNETYTITNLENSMTRDIADNNVLIINATQEDGSVIKMKVLGVEDKGCGIILTDQGVISGRFSYEDEELTLLLHFSGDSYSGYGYTMGASDSLIVSNYYNDLLRANKVRDSWRINQHYDGTITADNIDGIVETVLLLSDAEIATYSGTYIKELIQQYFGVSADMTLSEKYDEAADLYNGGPWYGDAGPEIYAMPTMLTSRGLYMSNASIDSYAVDMQTGDVVWCMNESISFSHDSIITEYHRNTPIASIDAEDVTVDPYTGGLWLCYAEENYSSDDWSDMFWYHYDQQPTYTVMLMDGTVLQGDWQTIYQTLGVYVQTESDEQSYYNQFVPGTTHSGIVRLLGVESEYDIVINKLPVSDIQLIYAEDIEIGHPNWSCVDFSNYDVRITYTDGTTEDIPIEFATPNAHYASYLYSEKMDISFPITVLDWTAANGCQVEILGYVISLNVGIEGFTSEFSVRNEGNELIFSRTLYDGTVVNQKVEAVVRGNCVYVESGPEGTSFYAKEYFYLEGGAIANCRVIVFEPIDSGNRTVTIELINEVDSTVLASTVTECPWYDAYSAGLKCDNSTILYMMADANYLGEATAENIDPIIRIADMLDEQYWTEPWFGVAGDQIIESVQQVFGVTIDPSLSEFYDTDTDVYMGILGYGDVLPSPYFTSPISVAFENEQWRTDFSFMDVDYTVWRNADNQITKYVTSENPVEEPEPEEPVDPEIPEEPITPEIIDIGSEILWNDKYALPGETVEVLISLPEGYEVKTLGVNNPTYDEDVFELVSGEWLLDGALITDWNNTNKVGAAMYLNNTALSGNVLKLTFVVKDTTIECDTDISLYLKVTTMVGETETTIVAATKELPISVRLFDEITVQGNSATARPEETVEIVFSFDEAQEIKTLGISDIVYDDTVLELIGGEWLIENALVSDWNQEKKIGALTFMENKSVSGGFFKLIFAVKSDAPEGDFEVSCTVTTKRMADDFEATVPTSVVHGTVTVQHILPGDLDGNSAVNSNDVVYLLYHTLFPENYPANQDADFNGDNAVNSNDVVYLLYHTLFPESYPI